MPRQQNLTRSRLSDLCVGARCLLPSIPIPHRKPEFVVHPHYSDCSTPFYDSWSLITCHHALETAAETAVHFFAFYAFDTVELPLKSRSGSNQLLWNMRMLIKCHSLYVQGTNTELASDDVAPYFPCSTTSPMTNSPLLLLQFRHRRYFHPFHVGTGRWQAKTAKENRSTIPYVPRPKSVAPVMF